MASNTHHRRKAEQLIDYAETVYAELQDVPPEGIEKTDYDDNGQPTGSVYRQPQARRRDELGKQLRGIYALAQVHATLALGEEAVNLPVAPEEAYEAPTDPSADEDTARDG